MSRWYLPRVLRTTTICCCALVLTLGANRALKNPLRNPTTNPAPSAAPATPPAGTAASQNSAFPKEFSVLLTRSIFAHGKNAVEAGPTTGPSTKPSFPDQAFILRGVALQGPVCTALLEDIAGGKTRQLHVGDDVFGGRVVAITLDGVDRTLGTQVVHIVVGQALDGTIPAQPMVPRQQLAGDGAPPGQPMPPTNIPGVPIPAAAKIIHSTE